MSNTSIQINASFSIKGHADDALRSHLHDEVAFAIKSIFAEGNATPSSNTDDCPYQNTTVQLDSVESQSVVQLDNAENQPSMPVNTYTAMVFSTAHCHPNDLDALDNLSETNGMIITRDTGCLIKLDPEDNSINQLEHISNELQALIDMAYHHNCCLIELDADASINDTLPVFSWE